MSGETSAVLNDRDAPSGRAMRALHWSIGALLLGPYLTGAGHRSDRQRGGRSLARDAAPLFGILLVVATVRRLLERSRSAIPPLPSGLPAGPRFATRLIAGTMVHGDRAAVCGSVVQPAIPPVNPRLGMDLFAMQGWVDLGRLGLITLHAIAALHHHFVRRDTVLVRILPAARHIITGVSAQRYLIKGDLS